MHQSPDCLRSSPRIDAEFDRVTRAYAAGDPLTVRYWARDLAADVVRMIEHSVAWYTDGKGEEDLGIHFLERFVPAQVADAEVTGTLTSRLPASPLSYEGVIVKVRWCVRVRLFFAGGRDFVSEHVFSVGSLPPARPAPEAPPPARPSAAESGEGASR